MATAYFMGPLERVLYLRTVGVLEGLGASMLASIAQHSREQFFVRGTSVTETGRPMRAIQFVIDGRVEVTRDGGSPRTVRAGGVVGLADLLARSAPGMGAVAVEDSRTLELEWDTLLDVCETHFPIVQACLRYFARRVHASLADMSTPGTLGTGIPYPTVSPLLLPDRVQALLSVGLFSEGHPDGLVDLARQVIPTNVPMGGALWRTGDPADHFLVMVTGAVRHTMGDRQFATGAMATLGLLDILVGDVRTEEVVAEHPVYALRADREPFLDMLEDHFELALDLLAHLANMVLSQAAATSGGR
jgi:CRP-like cAMP-binding protein